MSQRSVNPPRVIPAPRPRNRGEVARLHQLEDERRRRLRDRIRTVLAVGAAASLLAHVIVLVTLAFIRRELPEPPPPAPVAITFPVLQEEELTDLQKVDLEETPMEESALQDLPELAPPDLAANLPSVDLGPMPAGAVPGLSGAGDSTGSSPTLGGGGASTSFMGVSSQGYLFAYILDKSASMGRGGRFDQAMDELAMSVESLPDYAFFFVALYSTDPELYAANWTRATPRNVANFLRWLDTRHSSGNTLPMSAFEHAFSLPRRPEVIYFMTDGEIPQDTPERVARLNGSGKPTIIHAIAFGQESSRALLTRIANESGGTYRYVRTSGG